MSTHTTSPLAIKNGKYTHFLDEADIVYLAAQGAYTRLQLTKNRAITLSKKLKDVSENLADDCFFRIHHGYTVNLRHIVKYCNNGENYLEMTDNSRLPLAKSRKAAFFALFKKM